MLLCLQGVLVAVIAHLYGGHLPSNVVFPLLPTQTLTPALLISCSLAAPTK